MKSGAPTARQEKRTEGRTGVMCRQTFWQQLLIAAIPAVITGCLAFLGAQWDYFFPRQEIIAPLVLPDAEKGMPHAAPVQSAFGNWEDRNQSEPYLAETDGFVIAMTGGNDPANYADILIGPERDRLTVCSRMLRYDGAVLFLGELAVQRVQA